MDIQVKVGNRAPDFSGLNQDGKKVELKQFKGKKLALYFYPKDLTGGCINEACSLRDDFSVLKKAGVEIVGVSADTSAKHQKFIEKYALPFDLIADTEMEIIHAYGCWGPKFFMGKHYDGIIRKTFIIDEKGKISHIIDKVKTKEHAQQILEEINK